MVGLLFFSYYIVPYMFLFFLYLPIGFASGIILGMMLISISIDNDEYWPIFTRYINFEVKGYIIITILIIFHMFSKGIAISMNGLGFYTYLDGDLVLFNVGYFIIDLWGILSALFIYMRLYKKKRL